MKTSLCVASLAVLLCGTAPVWADDVPAVPASQNGGDYPDTAGGQEGAVYVGFDIDATGHTTNVKVLGSTEPGLFDQAALATVQGWSYQPRTVNGQPTAQTGNETRLRFIPPQDTLLPPVQLVSLPPLYSVPLYRAGQEGDVTLGYSVSAMGDPYNIHVISATNGRVFNRIAMFELSRERFLPATTNGIPQAIDGLTVTFQYRLANALIMPSIKIRPQVNFQFNGNLKGAPVIAYAAIAIDATGHVTAVKPLTDIQNSGFLEAFTDGLKAAVYRPLPADIAAHQTQVELIRMTFNLSSKCCTGEIDPANLGLPAKPEWVRLTYTLGTDGHPADVQVTAASDNASDQDSIVSSFKHSLFTPTIVNGAAVETPNLHTVIYIPGQTDYSFLRQAPTYPEGVDP